MLQCTCLKGLAKIGRKVEPEENYNLLFDKTVIEIIFKWTNVIIKYLKVISHMKWDMNWVKYIQGEQTVIEIIACLRLLLYSTVLNFQMPLMFENVMHWLQLDILCCVAKTYTVFIYFISIFYKIILMCLTPYKTFADIYIKFNVSFFYLL